MTQHNEVNIARFYQFSQKYFDLLYLFDDFSGPTSTICTTLTVHIKIPKYILKYLNSFSENEENNPCGFVENY